MQTPNSASLHSQSHPEITPDAQIDRFKKLLQFATVSRQIPSGIGLLALKWLEPLVKAIAPGEIDVRIVEYSNGYPNLFARWPGSRPELPGIHLNGHYDVVPAVLDKWSVDPFAAIEKDGWIYARGSQDMKIVISSYIEALLVLSRRGWRPTRTITLFFGADEEVGGSLGIGKFVETPLFRELNIGFALDEGLASEDNTIIAFYSERAVWWLHIDAHGPAGHGSRFIKNTATEKLLKAIAPFMKFRSEQELLLDCDPQHHGCSHALKKKHNLGDVVTVNLTALKAGVSVDGGENFMINVIPTDATAGFDIRIPPTVDLQEFETQIAQWCSDADCSYHFVHKVTEHAISDNDPSSNKFYRIFLQTVENLGLKIDPQIFSAGTDARFLRNEGINAIGFSPIPNHPILLHDHDERVHRDTFLQAIDTYVNIISDLASFVD